MQQGTPAPITDMQEVAENLYMLANADPADGDAWTGGNIAVWVTETGVVLVDTKLPGYGQTILEQVRGVTDKPVNHHHQHPHAFRPQRQQHRVSRDRHHRGARGYGRADGA